MRYFNVICVAVCLICLCFKTTYAENEKIVSETTEKNTIAGFKATPDSHWIDATSLFHETVQKIIDKHGLPRDNAIHIRKTPEIKVEGRIEIFNVMNIETNKPEKRNAILKRIGRRCYLYLEEGREFSGEILDAIVDNFDNKIYETCTKTFGNEAKPGIDGDDKISILMLDIKDGWKPGRGFVSGFFFPLDCYPADTVRYSNEREIIYLDCCQANPADLLYSGILAHEFQHMIHFNNDAREDKWLNEGCSQLAYYICGYGHPPQITAYMANPSDDSTIWQNSIEDYGAVYLLHYYIFHKYAGKNLKDRQKFYRELIASPLKGIESIDALLARYGSGKTFEDVYKDWLITNLINDSKIEDGRYGYGPELKMRVKTTHNFTSLPAKIEKAQLLNHGAANILFTPFISHLPETPAIIEKFIIYSEKPAVVEWGVNNWRPLSSDYLPPSSIVKDGTAETVMIGPDESGIYSLEAGPFAGVIPSIESFNYRLRYNDGSVSEDKTIHIIGPAGKNNAAQKRVTEKNILLIDFKGAKPTTADKNKLFRLIQIVEDAEGKISAGEIPLKNNQVKIAVPSYSKSIKKVYLITYQLNNKKLSFSINADTVSDMKDVKNAYIMKID